MTPDDVVELEDGARVTHVIFGPGTVLRKDHYAGFPFIEIHFDDHGIKQLEPSFTASKLEREWP